MKTLQQIFDTVIFHGHYSQYYCPNISSSFMCNALSAALTAHNISQSEFKRAEAAIIRWLGNSGWGTLDAALLAHGVPSDFNERKDIYLNWKKRPKLSRCAHNEL